MLYQSVPPAIVVMSLNYYQDAPLTIIILATLYLSVVYGILTLLDHGVFQRRWGGQILGARFPRRLDAIAQGWVATFHSQSSNNRAHNPAHDFRKAGSH